MVPRFTSARSAISLIVIFSKSFSPIKWINAFMTMRILVFGAGVQGSYLAHALVRGGNDVTVLARGKRAEQLKKDGLVIRHYFQLKNTVDEVKVIHELQSDNLYDLVFVVMKYNNFPSVLPILAENQSQNIVLVGNNADAHGMQPIMGCHLMCVSYCKSL